MTHQKLPCVFPSGTERELGTLEGADTTSALRVRVESQGDGYVRLEQLAWSSDMGWYCQKSFVIPAELVRDLITTLRKAVCLLPQAARQHSSPLPFRPAPAPPSDAPAAAQRLDA